MLETVTSAKTLGVSILNNLKWNNHVELTIKKANKRLYFLVLLRRASVPMIDIIKFYTTTIRLILEYCTQVYHHALPGYLSEDIERRALSIVSRELSDQDSLDRFSLELLYDRRERLCYRLFQTISDPSHKLSVLLPIRHKEAYCMRRKLFFQMP